MLLNENSDGRVRNNYHSPEKKTLLGKWWAKLMESNTAPANADCMLPESYTRFMKKQHDIIKNGARAFATVLRIEDTGEKINFNPLMLLSLRIDEYTSVVVHITAETLVTGVRLPATGERIAIAFNPEDTSTIVLL